MKEKLTQLLQEGKDRIDAARSESELQEVKGLLLGKQGALTGLLKELPRLDVSLRPEIPNSSLIFPSCDWRRSWFCM